MRKKLKAAYTLVEQLYTGAQRIITTASHNNPAPSLIQDTLSKLSMLPSRIEELKKSSGDVDGIKQQLADLQAKYTTETEQYQKQIADRDYADAVNRAIADKGVKFSSKAAENAFIADLTANRLTVKEGVLDGFETYLKAQQDSDPTAFQSDKPAPTFVKPVGPGGPPANESKGAMYAKQFNQMYAPKTTTKE